MNRTKKLFIRLVALFILTVLDTIGAAALVGERVAVGALIAGVLAIAKVARDLAKEVVKDGEFPDDAEMDAAFNKSLEGKE